MSGIIPFDVAVVGCGPVGALAANFAAAAGLATLVIDRETEPHPLPRAVHVDHEMMRLFQSAGIADRVAPLMRETEGHLHVGADHGVIRYMGTAGRPKPFGWANDYFFYQPELEAALREGIVRFPHAELRLGVTLESLAQDDAAVTLQLDAGDRRSTERARFVIACDGARSIVRTASGIALEDLHFEEPWLVVDAEVEGPVTFPELWGVPEAADLQQLSVMMCDPARPATIVPGRGNIRRWEFMLLPGEDDAEMMRPERVAELLGPFVAGVPHRIVRAATYRFHGLIAERWRDGRIFLAGDAAHQTPPFFGQGMCHGMRDVANLTWKLDLVTRGIAAMALLDTYQLERDPHVRRVVSAAIDAGRYICELDPARAAMRDAGLRERARAGAPSTAGDLISPIDDGVVARGTPGAGERFVQPWVATDDGEGPALLDDVTGQGWRLFVRDPTPDDRAAAATLAAVAVTLVDVSLIADDGTLGRWLDQRGVRAALVRPDFYVFGTAADDTGALVSAARRALAIQRSPHE